MKIKKILQGFIIGAFVFSCCTAGFSVHAKTQAVNPQNKSYAWLEDLFIRESSAQNTLNKMIPLTNYPYSRTCSEFKADVKNSLALHPTDSSTVEENYYSMLTQANSIMIAMGATDSYETEKKWLIEQYGIVYPTEGNDYTELYTNVLYGSLKYTMFKTLYGKTLVIPHGATLEKAIVIYIDTVTDSDNSISVTHIDTVKEYAIAVMRERLIADGHFDVDENTSDEDIYRYNTILFIRNAGYTIDNDATGEQIRIYYYIAAVWKTYGVKVQPAEMAVAMGSSPASERDEAVQLLILKTMIEEKGENLPASATVESAFKKTLELGYFKLANGFYSDIYNYRVELQYARSNVWITPHSFAYMMPNGSSQNTLIKINGSYVVDKMPIKISLDTSKAQQLVEVTVKYINGSLVQSKNYKITFVQGKSQAPSTTVNNPDNGSTVYDSSTLPYITSYEGNTYYLGDLGTLPDGTIVTNEDGTIIGIDDSSQNSAVDSASDYDPANSADVSAVPLKEKLREKLPLISIITALLLSAAAVIWLMFKKKGAAK